MTNNRMDEHLIDAFIENVKFLREVGHNDERIYQHLGVSKELFEKRLERAGMKLGSAA